MVTEVEALKKAVAKAEKKATTEQALCEKHAARVIKAEQELQEAVKNSSVTAVDRLLSALSGHFTAKDLGALHYFLGLEVSESPAGLTLTRHQNSLDLLQRAALDGALLPSDDATEYRIIVGGLQYLTITRPDISYEFASSVYLLECSLGVL
nr:uncharacterized mitochondrial protein AtMg00810-like [Aegilops tauschii subsp. strangulata]